MPNSAERATFRHNILNKVSFKRVDRHRAMFLISRTWTKFAHMGLRPTDAMLMAPPPLVGESPLDPSDLEFAAPLRGGEDINDRLDRPVDVTADTQALSIRMPPTLPQAPAATVRRGSASNSPTIESW